MLRTAQSVTPSLTGMDVAISLGLYVVVYLIMFPTGIGFMAGIVRRGCEEIGDVASPIEAGLSAAPFLKQAGE